MKKYIVTAVDVGECCDGHASCCGVFNSREDAKKYITEDMKDAIHMSGIEDMEVDWEDFEVWQPGMEGMDGCVWDIHEIDTEWNDVSKLKNDE